MSDFFSLHFAESVIKKNGMKDSEEYFVETICESGMKRDKDIISGCGILSMQWPLTINLIIRASNNLNNGAIAQTVPTFLHSSSVKLLPLLPKEHIATTKCVLTKSYPDTLVFLRSSRNDEKSVFNNQKRIWSLERGRNYCLVLWKGSTSILVKRNNAFFPRLFQEEIRDQHECFLSCKNERRGDTKITRKCWPNKAITKMYALFFVNGFLAP